jgi:glycosyltransferase involved in cell wall biosynthesis
MDNNIIVSVCMITYNHDAYIRQAIEGVLLQECNFRVELIIGEDCSTDNTAKIIQSYAIKFPQKIKVRYNRPNLGMIPNFIKTLQECTGKYIAICEGDDYWTDPYKLQKQVDFLEANKEYGLVFSRFEAYHENSKQSAESKFVSWDGHVFFAMQRRPIGSTLTSVMRKTALEPLMARIVKQNLQFTIDIWFWQQITLNWKMHCIDDVTAVYRVHPGGATKRRDGTFGPLEVLCRIDVYNSFFTEHNIPVSFSNKFLISKLFIGTYIRLVKNKLSDKYIKIGRTLILKKPWLLMGIFPFSIHFLKKIFLGTKISGE